MQPNSSSGFVQQPVYANSTYYYNQPTYNPAPAPTTRMVTRSAAMLAAEQLPSVSNQSIVNQRSHRRQAEEQQHQPSSLMNFAAKIASNFGLTSKQLPAEPSSEAGRRLWRR